MTEVLKYGAWPLVFLVVCLVLVWRFAGPVQEILRAIKQRIDSDVQLDRLEELKAEREAAVAKLTVEEEAELRKAQLRKEAAEADAAAKVDAATIEARTEAERQVIAAAARGRAVAAEKGALLPATNPEAILRILRNIYNDEMSGRISSAKVSFPDWLARSRELSSLVAGHV